jgi:hypothetical protein
MKRKLVRPKEPKRLIRKAAIDESQKWPRTRPAYRIKAKHLSYDRWIMPGEIGTFLSDANGFGRFFPDKGGVCMKVPEADVVRVDLRPPQDRKVVRKGIPLPAAAKPVRKLRRG